MEVAVKFQSGMPRKMLYLPALAENLSGLRFI